MSAVAVSLPTRITTLRVVRSEWMKFGTLASNWLTAVAAFTLIVLLAAVIIWARASESSSPSIGELLNGVSWAQLLLPVLGAVFVCSEWSAGTSQVTFLTVPARWPVLLSKAAVMGAVSFLVGALGAAGALLLGSTNGVEISTDPLLVMRLVIGAGVYLGGLAIFAVGVGAIVRNLIASILTVVGLLWVLPLLVALIPWAAVQRIIPYLPTPAGGLLVSVENTASQLSLLSGGAVLFAWTFAALLGAVMVLRARNV